MKKLATLLIAAGLVFGASASANAIDFKVKGDWWVVFDYGQHGNFQKNQGKGKNGYNGAQDEFNASQRFRIQLDAVASESLSGTVFFELGGQNWGKNKDGSALGADGKVVKLKRAYLDWMVPETDVKVRMGIIGLDGPSFALKHSQFFADDVAGLTVSGNFNDNIGLTAFWARPYNDNYGGYKDANGKYQNTDYMDNVDVFGLIIPLSFDGFKVTPFGSIAAIGPNSFRNDANGYFSSVSSDASAKFTRAGMLPAWGVGGGKSIKDARLSQYGTGWWAGLTADITAADPFHFALDFTYGGVQYDESRMNRAGWLVAGVAEYKMDWGTPGIVAWYGSGDDDDLGNGSERLPYLCLNAGKNDFSDYAFDGRKEFDREKTVGESMSGLWGVGLRIKDMSFLEDLKHTFRVTYMGGTNSPDVLKKIARGCYDATTGTYKGGYTGGFGDYGVGVENLYLTTEDSLVEIGLYNEYKMYQNFKVIFDFAYIFQNMSSASKRNLTRMGVMNNRESCDAWNAQLSFAYQF